MGSNVEGRTMRIISLMLVILGLSIHTQAIADTVTSITPKDALQRLLDGNQRFVKDNSIGPNRNQERRAATAAQQKPFAIIMGCSDSRVPPELAFDQGIGDIFVVRVAGNVVSAIELDSVEFSAIHNNSSIVIVLGHENCGAVNAVLTNNTQDIESVAALIKPAVDKNHTLVSAIEANVRNGVTRIKQSPPIAKLMKEGKIDVVGGYYDLSSGAVRILKD
jgi:carbonic anhydrase